MHWESREAIVAWYERPETRQWLERIFVCDTGEILQQARVAHRGTS